MIQVRHIDTDTNGSTSQTYTCCLQHMLPLFLSCTFDDKCNKHRQYNKQIVISHLHMIGKDLQCGEECRDKQSPGVLTPECQHHTGYHGRKVCQGDYLPYMSSSNDNKEIAAESPYYSTQRCQIPSEVKGTQQDIEAQEIGKDIPYIFGKPQMIGFLHFCKRIGTLIRRSCLVCRHTPEYRICPTGTLACTLIVFRSLLSCSTTSRRVMPVKDTPLDVGREEIGK